jgi:vancomycin resistance protein YoaR
LLTSIYQKVFTIKRHINLPLALNLNQEKLSEKVTEIAEEVAVEPVYPSAEISNGEVVVEKGQKGEEVDREKLLKDINDNVAYVNLKPLVINTNFIDVTLSDEQALIYRERANKLLAKRLVISFEDVEISYSKDTLLEFLEPKGGFKESQIASAAESTATKINRPAQNPTFVFVSQGDTSGKVQEFTPSKDGIEVKTEELKTELLKALESLENQDQEQINITPKVVSTPPEYQTGEINNLGIKELIGRGKSRFVGSISSRIHNVALASSRFNGILIKPGETFSFNQTLGDVSADTGYQQAYIIKEGSTILGDGGGVCQVSTTFFRAVLNAGLPVIERRAHAYRVGYYEQDSPPGLDATVYDPSPDFKFKNDTPAHILIQTKVDTKAKTLVFEIYGTSDGRVATTTKPVVKEPTPPPEDLYIDDPTLPTGQVKQIDWKAWGAKVSFKYTVTRNGETIYEKTFNSTYQPWQAKFLRGTGPAQ